MLSKGLVGLNHKTYSKKVHQHISLTLRKLTLLKKNYESRPSIIEIRNNLKPSHELNISTFQTNPSEVKKLIMSLDTKKATGVDKIPPKLVKLAADVLATRLSLAINSSIDKGAFSQSCISFPR